MRGRARSWEGIIDEASFRSLSVDCGAINVSKRSIVVKQALKSRRVKAGSKEVLNILGVVYSCII